MEELVAAGAVDPASVGVYAVGRVVLAQRPDAPVLLRSARDLAGEPFASARIAIANPATAPYGAAARQVLDVLGSQGPALEERLVIADNVAQAPEFARTGNAEVAFAVASNLPPEGIHAVDVPGEMHEPIEQAGALTRRGAAREAAGSLHEHLLGEAGRAVLQAHGFAAPAP